MKYHLITPFASLVYVAPDGTLRHAPPGSVAHPLTLNADLSLATGGRPADFDAVAQGDGLVKLCDGPDQLRAAADGGFERCAANHPDILLHLTDAVLLADLRLLLGQRWAVVSRGIIAPWKVVPTAGGIYLRLGPIETALPDVLASLRSAGPGTLGRNKRLALLHDGWQITTLLLFRPLAWYAAFGPPDCFACLRMALASLFEIGEWDGEALVLTDPGHADLGETLPEAWRARVHVAAIPAADMLDFTLARYRVVDVPLVRVCQPLLYLDIDVIADAPLRQLLVDLLFTDALCICPERPLATPEDYYGASIFEAEGTALTGREIGFSTGLMGMRHIETAEHAFRLTLRTATSYPPLVQNRSLFACYDQPVMNYVAHKLGLPLDNQRLARRVMNMWHWLERPKERRGLSHFTGGVNQFAAKQVRMQAYLQELSGG